MSQELGWRPGRVVFWLNMFSPHQAPYIRELAADGGIEVVLVAASATVGERSRLGWSTPQLGDANGIATPSPRIVTRLLRYRPEDSLHVVGGLSGRPFLHEILGARERLGLKCAFVAEGADPRGLLGDMRRIKYRWISWRLMNRFDFALAMGQSGVDWYRQCGWPAKSVFCFAYATDLHSEPPLPGPPHAADQSVRIVYAGQLIRRKGLDVLLRALAGTTTPHWRLEIIGHGTLEGDLKQLAQSLGVASRTSFSGSLPDFRVRERMAGADLLVLPSRFDGWGAVVNEALQAGTPVLCSDMCGAKELLQEGKHGEVVRSEQVADWSAALARWIAMGPPALAHREAIRLWATQRISAAAIAHYFLGVAAHVYKGEARPTPPWLTSSEEVHTVPCR